MSKNIVIVIVIIVIALGLTLLVDASRKDVNEVPVTLDGQSETSDTDDGTTSGIVFQTLDGGEYALSESLGRVTLINFWASWCPPCVAELPDLIELADAHPDMLDMIFVSNDMTQQAIDKFMANLPEDIQERRDLPNVVMAWDPKGEITRDIFQTHQLPETIIFTPEGKIDRKIVGVTDWSGQEMNAYLAYLAGDMSEALPEQTEIINDPEKMSEEDVEELTVDLPQGTEASDVSEDVNTPPMAEEGAVTPTEQEPLQ
ncbi:MAG: hypothetical protein CMH28_08865 [Micavibrio sp.]|nr:hypothetical protein [Micavibrio sp.]|tara:strand:- start:431 stop:1204 length:774 start_codon:yes stop_codon:yes gene_type:complete